MNRISRIRTSRTSHPRIHPEPLEPRQLLAAAPVFYTPGAVTLGSSGQVAFTGTQDLAPGTTYSYDLNNDGTFEVDSSTSPACDVPAAELASVGPHTISARINDPLGTHSDYQIQIPVNPAPDYYPIIDGLVWNYRGVEEGKQATWTYTLTNSALNGTPAILVTSNQDYTRSGAEVDAADYYHLSDGILSQVRTQSHYWSSGNSVTIDSSPSCPSYVLDQHGGWSHTWDGVHLSFVGTYPALGRITGAGTAKVTLSVQPLRSVRLANGLGFTQVMPITWEMQTVLSYSNGVVQSIHQKETDYFVQGLGIIKVAATGTTPTQQELASLPDWAKYLCLSSDGILHVNGTTSDDTITFAVKGKTLTCYRNGVPDSLPLAIVRGIIITGQGGNDSIDASKLSIPVTITTGSGNDSILGSKAADSIFSGDGNDTIISGNGNDALLAGNGTNYIDGGTGDDTITAGSGANAIHGGSGNDLITAGTGSGDQPNILYGDAGNDTITGGSGNDTLAGGLGSDLLAGNAGTNRYEAADGVIDILDARGGRNDTGLWDTAAVQDTILGKITPA